MQQEEKNIIVYDGDTLFESNKINKQKKFQ